MSDLSDAQDERDRYRNLNKKLERFYYRIMGGFGLAITLIVSILIGFWLGG